MIKPNKVDVKQNKKQRKEKNNHHSTRIKGEIRSSVPLLPADIKVTVLFEQDVSDVLAVKQQIVLDISGTCGWGGGVLVLPGETHHEVAQDTSGHKALEFLSGTRQIASRGY